MIKLRSAAFATVAAILTVLASSDAFPAAARPLDPDQPAPHSQDWILRLIADLSPSTVNSYGATTAGAGVPAPFFIPEP